VEGRDVRAILRDGSDDAALVAFLAETWRSRDDRYSELRTLSTREGRPDLPKVEMFAMGG
jgi:cyclic pyranopterin phosphate synthase